MVAWTLPNGERFRAVLGEVYRSDRRKQKSSPLGIDGGRLVAY